MAATTTTAGAHLQRDGAPFQVRGRANVEVRMLVQQPHQLLQQEHVFTDDEDFMACSPRRGQRCRPAKRS
ncbi:MAG: hypothetical protein U0531_13490 [Dehalococcoidia bacterium]